MLELAQQLGHALGTKLGETHARLMIDISLTHSKVACSSVAVLVLDGWGKKWENKYGAGSQNSQALGASQSGPGFWISFEGSSCAIHSLYTRCNSDIAH